MTSGRFPAAPLDGFARVVTASTWVLAAGLAAGGAIVAAVSDVSAGGAMAGVGAGLVALLLVTRPRRPVAYVVAGERLEIERAGTGPRTFVGRIGEARRGRLGLRIVGDGGEYGYLGRFRADGHLVQAFVTSRRDVVLLRAGDRRLALSPADPDAFVAALAGGSDA